MVGGMATITQFEDILAWQKARELSNAVDAASSQGRFAKDFGLKDQIQRAACSVMDNIAEGFGRSGNREFRQALSQAKGSVHEVRSQLHKAHDRGYLTPEKYNELLNLARETERLIGGFIRYLQTSSQRGAKFKSGPREDR